MNQEIIRAILQSSGRFVESLTDKKNLDKIMEKLPAIDSTTAMALSTSLTDLISYKVSPEIYQRYAVRIQVIEVLREWIRPTIGLTAHQTFCQSDKALQLCERLVKTYLQSDIDHGTSSNHLITFGRGLINLAMINPLYVPHLKGLVEKIAELDVEDPCSYELVESLLEHEQQFQLDFSTIEKLYVVHQARLIENPLVDCLVANLNAQNDGTSYSTIGSFDKLIQYTAQSPKIFQISCSILKELFTHSEYLSLTLNYIQFVLENILLNRRDNREYIVDLYPTNLQPCVILLRIDPYYHTKNSKDYVLQSLKDIYTENKDKLLILMTHFPKWLNTLSNHITDIESTI